MDGTRVAVVTGAASGIGAAAARRLAAGGYRVWLADLAEERCESVAGEIRLGGGDASALRLDVGDAESVRAAFATITARDPALRVLVNNAGVVAVRRFEDWTQEEWERLYRINAVGTYLCLQAALPALRAASPPPARVINVASAGGKVPSPFVAPYAASKAAVISLTRSAAAALAPGILVNCVCPAIVETPMWREIDPGFAEAGGGKTMEDWVAALPIRRAATPDEIANVVAFLAGDDSGYIVGEDLNVDGGFTMH